MMDGDDVVFYFNELLVPCQQVLIGLHEANIVVRKRRIDVFNRLEHVAWFTEVSPNGELPVMQVGGGETVIGLEKCLYWIAGQMQEGSKKNFISSSGEQKKMKSFSKINDCLEELTFAICLHPKNATVSVIRWPFCEPALRESVRSYPVRASGFLEKYGQENSKMANFGELVRAESLFEKYLENDACQKYVSVLREEIKALLLPFEELLADDSRVGIWLDGLQFSAHDCMFSAILVRLYQLGLEEDLWEAGNLPHVTFYAREAFNRPSVLKVTKWKENENMVQKIDLEPPENKAARYAMYAALGLAGAYVFKKVFKSS